MENILQELDSNIKISRPELYRDLKNPLGEHEIQRLEERYHVRIPANLKTVYQWKNGQKSSSYEAFVNNSMFIPLEESLEIATELTSMIGTDFEAENWWNENWIPIFHNGGGDYICYDTEGIFTGSKGQILEFWHRDEDRNVIAADLESFFNQLNKYYSETSVEEYDEFFTIEIQRGFPKNFIVS
ncbi:SMI1/KNR4 family protein [Chryseobacterium sp.]|uniref:SMI1/KNR4 family protein n=1 Tax=Chryseobacterium sp. TaxID=1871047 RepID=UPI0025BAC756|nr:SMI1/KNR4 family protein [Chryseobacterium sp.]MBV8327213.1 SMI1/KNR4 family protein [Chryseobacterium sp.]